MTHDANKIQKAEPVLGGSGPSLQRRRLVRGAVAVAPVVLTLRSGAVAAASCTGAKLISNLDQLGSSENFAITGNTIGLANGDQCFTSPSVCVDTNKISAGVANGTVEVQGSNAFCRGGTYTDGQQVAILSSTSATSLLA